MNLLGVNAEAVLPTGLVPFSVLATSSIVQDGHGTLPLLAESRRGLVKVKAVDVAAGLLLGGAMLLGT